MNTFEAFDELEDQLEIPYQKYLNQLQYNSTVDDLIYCPHCKSEEIVVEKQKDPKIGFVPKIFTIRMHDKFESNKPNFPRVEKIFEMMMCHCNTCGRPFATIEKEFQKIGNKIHRIRNIKEFFLMPYRE